MIDTQSDPGSWAEALEQPRQSERFIVALPFPPKELMPNKARTRHWGTNSTTAKDYRADCMIACHEAVGTFDWLPEFPIMVEMTFHGPDRRHRDLDGLLSACKAGLDAIAEYIGVDDKHFEFTIRRGEVRKPSVVVVVI